MRRVRWAWVIVFCAALALAPVLAQEQPSLGEVARRLREQKKKPSKPARLWTNDDVAQIRGVVSVVGQPAPLPAEEKPEAARPEPASAEDKEKDRADTEAALISEKERLATAQRDLDLLQRDYDLQRQQFFSNPAYASDAAGKARLDSLSTQIGDKQQEIEQAKRKVAVLEEKLATLKGPASPPKPETPPQ